MKNVKQFYSRQADYILVVSFKGTSHGEPSLLQEKAKHVVIYERG